MCKREGRKIRIRYANITVLYICFPRQRFGYQVPPANGDSSICSYLCEKRWVAAKCHAKVSHRDRFRDHRNFQAGSHDGTGYAAVALVDDQSDDRPPPSNDRANSPSWLHWRRCGKWAFDADMEDTVRAGRFRQSKSRRKNGRWQKCRLHAY